MFKSVTSQHTSETCLEAARKATPFEYIIYYYSFHQESSFCLQSDSKKQLLKGVHSSLI